MGKLSFLVGLGAGYVLGARAGKQRYEQIKAQANKAWENPQVQDKVGTVTEQVKAKAPQVAAAAGGAALKAAKSAPGVKNSEEELPETVHRGADGELHADTSGFGPGSNKLP
ncbi:hypothetical protein ACMYYO_01815 [Dermacoccaceae bacterium W4C1]